VSYDIAIIGAGAAGLTAAIFARRAAPHARIVALDGAPKIGAKILISGGGRCNVTHYAVDADDFNGNRNAINKVLRTFTVEETIAWFAEMGVGLEREETGKLFPATDKARTVVDALLRAAEGVEIRTGTRVLTCHPERSEGPGWSGDAPPDHPGPSLTLAMTGGGKIDAKRVILATGGKSVPKTGSDGHGYALARSLGHTTTDVFPALVPLLLEPGHFLTTLSGTSTEAELAVRGGTGKVLTRVRGSLLFTHFGLSGPAALDVSRHWIAAKRDDPQAILTASFLPDETFESLDRLLQSGSVRGRIPARLLEILQPEAKTKEARRAFVRNLVELPVPVKSDRGFDYAEVTAGGVPLAEIDLATMASRRCKNLFLCGEILDVDGRIGGFNFQWAWATGRLAGLNAARSLH
jgi:predicted Rossmann fold flavoprotein